MKKVIALLLCGTLVASCGGGGDSAVGPGTGAEGSNGTDVPHVSIDANVISLFRSGGVGEFTLTAGDDVTTGYIFSPSLTLTLAELQSDKVLIPFDVDGLPIQASDQFTQLRVGDVTIDGVTVRAAAATTSDQVARLIVFQDTFINRSPVFITQGSRAVDVPPSGAAIYSGVFAMQDDGFNVVPELGSFTATADFSNASVEFSGATASYQASGSALISGNELSSDSITVVDRPFGIVEIGSLRGDFHGQGASSMAGVIYTADRFTYQGGFVGSR
jgi:hypothetical protein